MSETNDKKHPIQGVMDTAMQNIKEMIDVNTIVGEPITTQTGSIIIPVSKVNVGFASGGSDFTTKAHQANTENLCFGGGSGAAITLTPIAFLIVTSTGSVSLLPIDQPSLSTIDKLVDMIPDLIDRIKNAVSNKSSSKNEDDENMDEVEYVG